MATRREQPRDLTTPTIAVVVVTYNSAAVLPGLLDSLDDGLRGVRWHLTIADNNSADDSVAIAVAAVPGCHIEQTGRNAGYAAAFNAAVRSAPAYDAVLILNPDVRLRPGSVATLMSRLGDGVGITVPRIVGEDGQVALSLRREPSVPRAFGEAVLGQRAGRFPALGETVVDPSAYLSDGSADWATGAVMLMSRACLDACGPWDERFFLYSEETEFALRARDRGFRTDLVADAEAVHIGGESRVSPALWSLLTVNKVRLYRMRHSGAATALFWSATFLREASRAALGHPRSKQAIAALVRPSRLPFPPK
ncbi:glycosyltransferase family 2 protein [Actinoplanes sp. TBRC 11911]|uniref:glycosyltransferase family 2 protein n=1 Tax=Actinoplanes sp. TBRC 11911 TaxID=2729386 RepID=UPI00145F9690|nr:glycosyltransferase family 2 protein [Actinoplanes sp. TBRC 11911]NMO57804.1 glycosyltransferase family 2 protein [Actinoplanes sp. TBRC 11911]